MDAMIKKFPAQIGEAMQIGEGVTIDKIEKGCIQNILVAGLGGSGIGGNFVQSFTRGELPVPMQISKRYNIPDYINENSLVIVSSYSGNTEETMASFEEARSKSAQIFIITSGGKLLDIAHKEGIDHAQLPDNWSSPRACLGYSLIQQLYLLHKLGMIDDAFKSALENSKERLENEGDAIAEKAEHLANYLQGKTAVIYSSDQYEPVGIRWRQQINENAKKLCWHHVVPEMNHNELVGWRDQREDLAVIFLRNKDDHPRSQIRMGINKEIIGEYASTLIEVKSKGDSMIERAMYLVHLGDWMSYFLSQLRGMDAVEVKVIDYLKGELKKY